MNTAVRSHVPCALKNDIAVLGSLKVDWSKPLSEKNSELTRQKDGRQQPGDAACAGTDSEPT
jgi:hypothetical protein